MITFWLNESLNYKDKSINRITVSNYPPFTGYKEGDTVFVDTDSITNHPESATLGENVVNKNSP